VKSLRVIGVVVLLVVLVVSATTTTARSSARLIAAPCNASLLAAPYHGPLKVRSVNSFGCVGDWAYLWATIGSGVQEISVTEVLHYHPATSSWKNASRLRYCGHHLLPNYVDRWGCHSN